MSRSHNGRQSHYRFNVLPLLLFVLGVVVVYQTIPSNTDTHYKTSPSPSTLMRMPSTVKAQHEVTIPVAPERSSPGFAQMLLDVVRRRDLNIVTAVEDAPKATNDKSLTPGSKKCTWGDVSCDMRGNQDIYHLDDDDDEDGWVYHDYYYGGEEDGNYEDFDYYEFYEDEDDDDDDYYGKEDRKRSAQKWTEHRGPPNRHGSPKTNPMVNADSVELTSRGSQGVPPPESNFNSGNSLLLLQQMQQKNDEYSEWVQQQKHASLPQPSWKPPTPFDPKTLFPKRPLNLPPTEQSHENFEKLRQSPRPLPPSVITNPPVYQGHHVTRAVLEARQRCLCGPIICGRKPNKCNRWGPPRLVKRSNSASSVESAPDAEDHHHFGNERDLLVHSESTSNQNFQVRREMGLSPSIPNEVGPDHSELAPRRLICDCGTYICTNYRNACMKWKEVPNRTRSVSENSVKLISRAHGENHVVDGSPRPTSGTENRTPVSVEKHYIPPYWRGSRRTHTTPAPKSTRLPRSDKVTRNTQNGFAQVFLPQKCRGTTKEERKQCQTSHLAAVLFYSLIGIFVTSIILLVLLRCYMCFRRRRNIAITRSRKIRNYSKGGTSPLSSTPGDSLSSKREKQGVDGDNGGGSRPIANLDGADDEDYWPKPSRREHRTWNIFTRRQRVPGRFSPVPRPRAPRIPTLKLPQPVFATVRKVSGLGFEGMMATYKNGFKGKSTDISKVKWTSTI